jgi:hypothetical protein
LFLFLLEERENIVPGFVIVEPCVDELLQLLKILLVEIKLIPFGSVFGGILFLTPGFSGCCT